MSFLCCNSTSAFPRSLSSRHYRAHKMSVWLNLIPQLVKTGQRGSFPSHDSLTLEGPAWGVVRNASAVGKDVAG